MQYYPGTPPNDPNLLGQYLAEELRKIQESSIAESDTLRLRVLNVAPARPRNGTLAYADGTNWDPGSGEGVYAYEGGSWVKL